MDLIFCFFSSKKSYLISRHVGNFRLFWCYEEWSKWKFAEQKFAKSRDSYRLPILGHFAPNDLWFRYCSALIWFVMFSWVIFCKFLLGECSLRPFLVAPNSCDVFFLLLRALFSLSRFFLISDDDSDKCNLLSKADLSSSSGSGGGIIFEAIKAK